jgi:hypothetical protein
MANATTLSGTTISTAVATDPDLCRISGYLKNAHGQPLAGWSFTLRYCYVPLGIVTDTLLLQERLPIKADADGYVEFDLLRGAQVTLELPNLLPWVFKKLTVPDAVSSDLLDFLFPYLVSIEFIDPGPLSVDVGDIVSAALQGTLSNGEVVDVPGHTATFVSSDAAILSPAVPPSFRSLSAGAATVTVTEVDRSAIDQNKDRSGEALNFFTLPAVVLPAFPLSVTVNP